MNKVIAFFFILIFSIPGTIAQQVGIGTTTPALSAALEVNSITGAVLLPRMTNTQRNALSPVEGMLIYNTDFSKFQGYGLLNETVDQQSQTSNAFCTGAGCGTKWQSFIQGPLTGILTSVKVYLMGWSGCLPTTVTIRIRSGTGIGGDVLQTSSLVVQAAGTNLYTAPFHTSVTAGAAYTIELESPSTGCNPGNDNVLWLMSTTNTYPFGSCFCCTAQPNQDFTFFTYMGSFGWGNLY